MIFNTEDVKNYIPHRPPFLYVDGILEYDRGKRIIGIKVFKNDEYFFEGHFPGNPIVPGVIIVEALAQTGGVLVNSSFSEELKTSGYTNAYLIGLDRCKFRKPVSPGEELLLNVELIKRRSRILIFKGEASVDNQKVAEAQISASLV